MNCSNRVYVADAWPTDDLSEITAPGYKPPSSSFRAGIFRTKKGTLIIYPNGRVVINKCKSASDVAKTRRYCFLDLGIVLSNFKLVNIVGYMKINRKLDLPKLCQTIPKAIYEPELHCGLLFYIGKVSVIIYHTGVIISCGSRSKAEFRYVGRKIGWMLNK